MGVIIAAFLLGIGLSMDAFAVSICKGLCMKKVNIKQMLIIAAFFGGFQALMPLLGYLLASMFATYIQVVDHWIAFVLLAFIGGKMLFDVIRGDDEGDACECGKPFSVKEIFVMAIATSIDAAAAGIALAMSGDNIWLNISFVGVVTFLMSVGGVFIGNKVGTKLKDKATILGGIILILLGLKILLEHLGILNF